MAVREVDPVVSFMFRLELNDMTGYFTEVSGILSENPVAPIKSFRPKRKKSSCKCQVASMAAR
jgi:hypothetical protein